jgi:hypothetical protein
MNPSKAQSLASTLKEESMLPEKDNVDL